MKGNGFTLKIDLIRKLFLRCHLDRMNYYKINYFFFVFYEILNLIIIANCFLKYKGFFFIIH